MTLGETRVRLVFNPSANTAVDDIKRRAADCIDWCAEKSAMQDDSSYNASERKRLFALAMTHFEEAAMWAVKAVTE